MAKRIKKPPVDSVNDGTWMFNPHYFGHNCENEMCFFAKDLIQIASKLIELKGD